jgi:hypothetical protein
MRENQIVGLDGRLKAREGSGGGVMVWIDILDI